MVRLIAIVGTLALAGCAQPAVRYITRTVPVTVVRYAPVPAALTATCQKAQPADRTVAAVVLAGHARGVCVDLLNGQMDAIRAAQPASASTR